MSDATPRQVLVGTYRPGQLDRWPGFYNYPLADDDTLRAEDAGKIDQLWLFLGTASQKTFDAEFIGVKTREELIRDYGYPKRGRPHGSRYLLFRTREVYAPAKNIAGVVVRLSDFADSLEVQRKLAAWLASHHRDDPEMAALLPEILASVPPERLCVCEAAVQMDFLDLLYPIQREAGALKTFSMLDNMSVIDLFAGCGGMSLGFELAGFTPILAIEKDEWAAETYAYNRQNVNVVTADITTIVNPLTEFPDVRDVLGIIGGPPCQGFSVSGGRDPKDPRNSLFMDYMRFVSAYKPVFFVLENVPGILSSVTKRGEKVRDVIISISGKIGYNVKVLLLNAADYGVPQSRQRVFFIGLRNDIPFIPEWLIPKKTTVVNPITIRQALSDLPVIAAGGGVEPMAYQTEAMNSFQEWSRKGSSAVFNHIAMRHTKRLVERFHVIKWGESAADVPREHMQRKRGNASEISGKVYTQNNMRPFPDRPSPTVPASFQSNFVHPLYDRNYTAREGARLQSFPDTYIFRGHRTTMSWEKHLSQYQQIGNAVPPLLAKALGNMIVDYLLHLSSAEEIVQKQETPHGANPQRKIG